MENNYNKNFTSNKKPKIQRISDKSFSLLYDELISRNISIHDYKENGKIVIATKGKMLYAITLVSQYMKDESSTYSYSFDKTVVEAEKYKIQNKCIPAVWHYVEWEGHAEGVILPTSQIRELLAENRYFSLRATDPNIICISCGALNIGLLKAISEF